MPPGLQIVPQALPQVGARRCDPALMAGMGRCGIVAGVVPIQLGSLLQLLDAGRRIMAGDGGHQQGAPVGREFLLLAEARQKPGLARSSEPPEIVLLFPPAAQVGVTLQEMGELMGHHEIGRAHV